MSLSSTEIKKDDSQRQLKGYTGRTIEKDIFLDRMEKRQLYFSKTPEKSVNRAMKTPREGCFSITMKQNHKLGQAM